ncbi:LysE family translocator [Acinetobacter halotolerans]|uniref:LysE family translocator n=1 Tax=Acinetobacter halotolerans TaxID=1752076 RepID=A0A4Q6XBH6_9GAMM|nr:LysE family translocator [Acinetobacter halotolerans]RZF55661.1 LysE family translocator [Acinetobacter halotolerans]
MENLFSYFLICLLLVISPGPNTFLIFNTASSVGKYDSFLKIFGLVSATYLHGLLSLFGISLIILNSPFLFNILKYIGAAYLLYLGVKFITSLLKRKEANSTESKVIAKKSALSSFNEGFLTQILNPKVSMFYIAAFPQFINFVDSNHYLKGIVLITIHALTIMTWFVFMTLSIKLFTNKSGDNKFTKVVSLISGVFLIYFSFLLITQPLPSY